MSAPALSTRCSLTTTAPAIISRRACSRLSTRPRSTSSISRRLRSLTLKGARHVQQQMSQSLAVVQPQQERISVPSEPLPTIHGHALSLLPFLRQQDTSLFAVRRRGLHVFLFWLSRPQ